MSAPHAAVNKMEVLVLMAKGAAVGAFLGAAYSAMPDTTTDLYDEIKMDVRELQSHVGVKPLAQFVADVEAIAQLARNVQQGVDAPLAQKATRGIRVLKLRVAAEGQRVVAATHLTSAVLLRCKTILVLVDQWVNRQVNNVDVVASS